MLDAIDLPFVQRGIAEVALLSVGAGLIGTSVVLRGLAFHSHAVGTAAFPGLVIADGIGFAAPLGAIGAGAVFALLVGLFPRRRGDDRGAEVALVLVGMLALGVILASDVYESSAGIETLLFGSLLLIDGGELLLAGVVSAAVLAMTALAGRHWVAHGFDAEGEAARPTWLEPALLLLVALATAAAVTALGALLVTALFVVPAATTRLWTSRIRSWQVATVVLCAIEGIAGVLVSVELNAPPGPVIAVLSGAVFALAAVVRALRRAGLGRPLARAATTLAAALLLAGCGSDSEAAGPTVAATTPVAGDLAATVGQGSVGITTLLSADTDPHDYEPRPADVVALADAELVVASGGDADAWIADALEDSGSNAEVLTLADHIEAPRTDGGELDPHWWHDPRNVAAVADDLAGALAAIGADRKVVGRGARDLERTALRLDRAVAACTGSIPAADRELVTDHDALGYFADRYGFRVIGSVIPATTTAAQPSAGELAELRETIEREGVRAVFPESSVATEVADVIAEETGASADHDLYGDSLGGEGSAGETWLGAEAANADAIVRGLTGGERGCPEASS